jgi:ribonuclease P protein component
MLHSVSLNENKDFRRLYKAGKSLVHSALVIYYSKNKLGVSRIGITVSKKVGNAVIRNRVKRIIVEAYRSLERLTPVGYDYVFVARGRAVKLKSTELARFISVMLNNAGMINNE